MPKRNPKLKTLTGEVVDFNRMLDDIFEKHHPDAFEEVEEMERDLDGSDCEGDDDE